MGQGEMRMKKKYLTAIMLVMASALICACGSNTTKPAANEENTAEEASEELTPEADNEPGQIVVKEVSSEDENEADKWDKILMNAGTEMTINGMNILYSIPNPNDPDFGDGMTVLTIDGTEYETGYAEWPVDSFVFANGDNLLIYLEKGYSNDWASTTLVTYSKEAGIKVHDEVWGGTVGDNLSITECTLESRVDLFGTWGTSIKYNVTENGLVQTDTYVQLINDIQSPEGTWYDEYDNEYIRSIYDEYGRRLLRVSTEFSAKQGDKDIVIPAGAVIYPIGYDDSISLFRVEYDGVETDITYTYNDDPEDPNSGLYIGDVNQYDLFEELPYAG